jgi:hypothetical protein
VDDGAVVGGEVAADVPGGDLDLSVPCGKEAVDVAACHVEGGSLFECEPVAEDSAGFEVDLGVGDGGLGDGGEEKVEVAEELTAIV